MAVEVESNLKKKIVRKGAVKKKSRVQKVKLRLHVESAKVEQGCFKADSMAALDFGYCERDFFLGPLIFANGAKISHSSNFEQQ